MTKRRRARELALRILYQWEIQKGDIEPQIEVFWKQNPTHPDVQSFATRIAMGACRHIEEIDSIIERFSENWTMDRISIVDKNIMRSSIYEMLYEREIPSKVSINEAIEIAKRYGTEDSSQFVNGILDRVKREMESIKPC